MVCELCGNDGATRAGMVEGNTLQLCQSCARFGTTVGGGHSGVPQATIQSRLEQRERRNTPRDIFSLQTTVLVVDFGDRIRSARNSRNLSRADLGKQVNIKESQIAHLERGETTPDETVGKRLERALEIRLWENPAESDNQVRGGTSGEAGLTMADFIKKG